LVGAGAAAIVVGGILGVSSKSDRDALLDARANDEARTLGDRAASHGTWATVLIGAGTGAVVAGIAWIVGGEP
jgi:hypothetical protein